MRPYFPRVENGITCLLTESNDGLLLVDTGFGLGDYANPGRFMRFFMAILRSPRDANEAAIHRIQRLGYHPSAVHHIVVTHLHLDHAGGLPDFPDARVHIFHPEYEHITSEKAGWEYLRDHWAHGPHWIPHRLTGEKWYGFEAIRLEGLEPETWMVPLVGHSPGHSGVAIHHGNGWVLHAGDAVPFNVAVDEVPDWISKRLIGPHVPRLREFIKTHPEVKVVGAHMSLDFYAQVGD
jgi:glyoxylase-like metal-dependent hydrolase (beta-lactamase superfamily II)